MGLAMIIRSRYFMMWQVKGIIRYRCFMMGFTMRGQGMRSI